MLVVVQTPDAVRARWLEHVGELDLTAQNQVLLEYFVHCCLHVIRRENSKLEQAEKENNKTQLVARSVVKALIVPEALFPVDFEFRNGTGKLRMWIERLNLRG